MGGCQAGMEPGPVESGGSGRIALGSNPVPQANKEVFGEVHEPRFRPAKVKIR